MLDANQIQMNFEKAKLDAQNLDDLATRMENLAKGEMEDSLNKLKSSWKGSNADLFINKSNQVKEDMTKAAANLRKVADYIRKTAQETYNTEMRNYEIAKKREAEIKNIAIPIINRIPHV